jgi:hypothetical protein
MGKLVVREPAPSRFCRGRIGIAITPLRTGPATEERERPAHTGHA